MSSIAKKEVEANSRILIVDDEPDMLGMLRLVLGKGCDCEVVSALSGKEALQLLAEVQPAVVVSDIKMPDLDGLSLLQRIREYDPAVSVVMMTGYGTIDMAVRALKDGAYDFLEKPFDRDNIVRVVKNALERTRLLRANSYLQKRLKSLGVVEGFVGQSAALKRALELIRRVADSDVTVLIRGESGTGKEVAARALHAMSSRSKRPMVTVNCPALPEHILESELFGYTKGAFTGALQDKKGLFLEADGSTILLDEIADIPVSVQTKLLRVLQEKEIHPLGQNRAFSVDARVVASTNQDLEAKIAEGTFREDLFYRLNVVTITMPSLTEMEEDIPLLIHHFLNEFKEQYDKAYLNLSTAALDHLCRRSWPGNVRELRNTVKRLVLLADGERIELNQLDESGQSLARQADCSFGDLCSLPYNEAKSRLLEEFSTKYLRELLTRCAGNVTSAAAECGLERQGLQRVMRRYGIRSTDFKK